MRIAFGLLLLLAAVGGRIALLPESGTRLVAMLGAALAISGAFSLGRRTKTEVQADGHLETVVQA